MLEWKEFYLLICVYGLRGPTDKIIRESIFCAVCCLCVRVGNFPFFNSYVFHEKASVGHLILQIEKQKWVKAKILLDYTNYINSILTVYQ